MFISVGCVERHGPGTGCSTVVHRIEKRRFVIEKSLNNRGKKGCQQYTSESFEKFDDHLKPCINEGCISQYYFLFFFGTSVVKDLITGGGKLPHQALSHVCFQDGLCK